MFGGGKSREDRVLSGDPRWDGIFGLDPECAQYLVDMGTLDGQTSENFEANHRID